MRRILCVFFVIFSGCAEEESPSGPRGAVDAGGAGGGGGGCATDLECGEGQVCSGGACRVGQCNLDRRCPEGQTCDRATFTCSGSTDDRCMGDAECTTGYCIAGRCEDVRRARVTDHDARRGPR